MILLLCSPSSRRKGLLEQAGFRERVDFLAVAVPERFIPPAPEGRLSLDQARQMVVKAAAAKIFSAERAGLLNDYGLSTAKTVLVGAETILFFDGQVLKRPIDPQLAVSSPGELIRVKARQRQMLKAIRDQELFCLTGLAVAQGDNTSQYHNSCVRTIIRMGCYSDRDIEGYLATGEALDRPGGFDLQGQGIVLSQGIKGSYSNIEGLPLLALLEHLRDPSLIDRVHFRLSEPDRGRYSVEREEISRSPTGRSGSPSVLLASQSPRRRELLKQILAADQIEILASQQEEPALDEEPVERVRRLALLKARAVYAQKKAYSPSIKIIIGADTEVVQNGEALGKPAGPGHAKQMLLGLQGRTHQVITGMALIDVQSGREYVDYVPTLVRFKSLTGVEIDTYITSGEPFGKAGGYGIQSKGALFVEEIDGSYSNVVGLPLERLSEILDKEFGLPVWQLAPDSGG